jgi:argininosuccinate synthase
MIFFDVCEGIYETPAGTILREAHLDIENITIDKVIAGNQLV